MDRERISTLLRATPPALPEPDPDFPALVRLIRRRRLRRLAATSVVAAVAVIGLVVPLTQLAGMGRATHDGTVPGAGRRSNGASTTSGTAGEPTVGLFACTGSGLDAITPDFAVQPDGVHLHVRNPGGAAALLLRTYGGARSYPVALSGTGDTDLVTPYVRPGRYEAACTDDAAADMNSATASARSLSITISDPEGLWTAPNVDCPSSGERIFLTGQPVSGRQNVVPLIRASVVGLLESDRIVPAAYPKSTEDFEYLVVRDGAAVALIRVGARHLPIDDAGLDVTSCDGSGIAAGQGAR